MIRWRCFLVFIVVLLLLGGCNRGINADIHPNEASNDISQQETFTGIIKYWDLFEGDISLKDTAELGLIEEVEIVNNSLDIYNAKYIAWELPIDKFEFPTASGWRINLNELNVKNTTKAGAMVLIPGYPEPPFIYIHNTDSAENKLLFREDVAEKGINAFKLQDFDLYINGEAVKITEQIEQIWQIHTNAEAYQPAYPVLDGDWAYYSLRLIHRKYPALQYEINLGICDDFLYIENLNSHCEVCLPVDQIRKTGKTGDGSQS